MTIEMLYHDAETLSKAIEVYEKLFSEKPTNKKELEIKAQNLRDYIQKILGHIEKLVLEEKNVIKRDIR